MMKKENSMTFTEIKNTIEFIEAALETVEYSGRQNSHAMSAAFRALAGLKDECAARIHLEEQAAADEKDQ